jgi:hypothetical protein
MAVTDLHTGYRLFTARRRMFNSPNNTRWSCINSSLPWLCITVLPFSLLSSLEPPYSPVEMMFDIQWRNHCTRDPKRFIQAGYEELSTNINLLKKKTYICSREIEVSSQALWNFCCTQEAQWDNTFSYSSLFHWIKFLVLRDSCQWRVTCIVHIVYLKSKICIFEI